MSHETVWASDLLMIGSMCTIAVLLLNIFHPNVFFKEPKADELPDLPAEKAPCTCRAEQSGHAMIAITHMKSKVMSAITEIEMEMRHYSRERDYRDEKTWI